MVVVEAEAAAEVDTEKAVSVTEAVADVAEEINVADEGLVLSANPGHKADVRTCTSMKLSNASIAGQVLAP